QLGGVLDRDDALVRRQVPGQHVEQRGLAGAGTAADHDVQPAEDARGEEVGDLRGEGTEADQVLGGVRVGGELPDGQRGAVDGDRRYDGVDPAPVGQPGVDHRARLVDPAPDPGHDPVDHPAQVVLVGERRVDGVDLPEALDVDPVPRVHHDLGDVRVAQQRLDRAVAEDLVDDLLVRLGPVGGGERLLLGQYLGQRLQDRPDQILVVAGQLVQLRAEQLQQRVVGALAHVGQRVVGPTRVAPGEAAGGVGHREAGDRDGGGR